MPLVIILLSAALVFALVKWLLLRREVAAMAAAARAMRLGADNRRLRVSSQDKAVASLAGAVNELYDQADEVRAAQIRAGDELRQNMADISHDLRTPLTSILGYLGLLAKADTPAEKREEYLGIATAKAEALRRMVDSLFELARLEAGAWHFEPAPLDAAEVLAQEIAAFYAPFTAARQQPDICLPSGPLPVVADAQALPRVFANLLQNILRHGGGEVEITAGREDGKARFRFANRAELLTETDVQKIFQRSFTGDAARSSKNTGLGLAITRQLVRRMDGEITAALEGRRLVITITFPLAQGALLS